MSVVSFPTTCYAGAGARTNANGLAGEAIAQGEILQKDTTTNRWMKAVANSTQAAADASGIALTGAGGANSPIVVLEEGLLEGLNDMKPGAFLALANVAGDATDDHATDLTEDTSYVTFVGVNRSATSTYIKFTASGVQLNLA